MDAGPFPMGRIQTFQSTDSNSVVTCSIYEERFDKHVSNVPVGFSGIESLLMRNGCIVPFKVYEHGTPIVVLDADAMQCTDKGYICHHYADVLSLGLFGFDDAGDINRIDWTNIVMSDDLQDVMVKLWTSNANQSHETYATSCGFTTSFAYASAMTAYNDPVHRALCEKLERRVWQSRLDRSACAYPQNMI